jgi:hypothetical protein
MKKIIVTMFIILLITSCQSNIETNQYDKENINTFFVKNKYNEENINKYFDVLEKKY